MKQFLIGILWKTCVNVVALELRGVWFDTRLCRAFFFCRAELYNDMYGLRVSDIFISGKRAVKEEKRSYIVNEYFWISKIPNTCSMMSSQDEMTQYTNFSPHQWFELQLSTAQARRQKNLQHTTRSVEIVALTTKGLQ